MALSSDVVLKHIALLFSSDTPASDRYLSDQALTEFQKHPEAWSVCRNLIEEGLDHLAGSSSPVATTVPVLYYASHTLVVRCRNSLHTLAEHEQIGLVGWLDRLLKHNSTIHSAPLAAVARQLCAAYSAAFLQSKSIQIDDLVDQWLGGLDRCGLVQNQQSTYSEVGRTLLGLELLLAISEDVTERRIVLDPATRFAVGRNVMSSAPYVCSVAGAIVLRSGNASIHVVAFRVIATWISAQWCSVALPNGSVTSPMLTALSTPTGQSDLHSMECRHHLYEGSSIFHVNVTLGVIAYALSTAGTLGCASVQPDDVKEVLIAAAEAASEIMSLSTELNRWSVGPMVVLAQACMSLAEYVVEALPRVDSSVGAGEPSLAKMLQISYQDQCIAAGPLGCDIDEWLEAAGRLAARLLGEFAERHIPNMLYFIHAEENRERCLNANPHLPASLLELIPTELPLYSVCGGTREAMPAAELKTFAMSFYKCAGKLIGQRASMEITLVALDVAYHTMTHYVNVDIVDNGNDSDSSRASSTTPTRDLDSSDNPHVCGCHDAGYEARHCGEECAHDFKPPPRRRRGSEILADCKSRAEEVLNAPLSLLILYATARVEWGSGVQWRAENIDAATAEQWNTLRNTVAVLLREAVLVLNPSRIISWAGDVLMNVMSEMSGTDSELPWRRVEALLFVLCHVAPRAHPGHDDIIPQVLPSLPRFPLPPPPPPLPNPPAVSIGAGALLVTAQSAALIAVTTGYISLHLDLLSLLSDFLVNRYFQLHELISSAEVVIDPRDQVTRTMRCLGFAISMLISEAAPVIVSSSQGSKRTERDEPNASSFSSLISSIMTLVALPNQDAEAQSDIIDAAVALVCAIEDFPEISASLNPLVDHLSGEVQKYVDQARATSPSDRSRIKVAEVVMAVTHWLAPLSRFKCRVGVVPSMLEHPVVTCMQRTWKLAGQVFNEFAWCSPVIESLISAWGSILSLLGANHGRAILRRVVYIVTDSFEAQPACHQLAFLRTAAAVYGHELDNDVLGIITTAVSSMMEIITANATPLPATLSVYPPANLTGATQMHIKHFVTSNVEAAAAIPALLESVLSPLTLAARIVVSRAPWIGLACELICHLFDAAYSLSINQVVSSCLTALYRLPLCYVRLMSTANSGTVLGSEFAGLASSVKAFMSPLLCRIAPCVVGIVLSSMLATAKSDNESHFDSSRALLVWYYCNIGNDEHLREFIPRDTGILLFANGMRDQLGTLDILTDAEMGTLLNQLSTCSSQQSLCTVLQCASELWSVRLKKKNSS